MLVGHTKIEPTELGVDALKRVADARDIAIGQSNKFLLAGIFSAVFYAVKVAGLRLDLVIADTRIFETPYGLFVFGAIGSICFILAQLRFLDGKALDLRLKAIAPTEPSYGLTYETFPSAHNWLLPSDEAFNGDSASAFQKSMFTIVGLLTLVIYSLPLASSAHFLLSWPTMAGENYTSFQWWIVLMLFVGGIAAYIFCQTIYGKGRVD